MTDDDSRAKTEWRLSLLGGFELGTLSGARIRVAPRKAQALLAYLAVRPGRRHTRSKLAALLWGSFPAGQARNSVRQALFVLRRALTPLGVAALAFDGDQVSLAVDALCVDVAEFERLAVGGSSQQLLEAMDAYRGDLLDGFDLAGAEAFEEWLLWERSRLRELIVDSLARELQRTDATDTRAVNAAMRLLALDPLHETAHRTLMRSYTAQGRRAAAVRQYQTCVETLQLELGIEPEPETQRLYEELRSSTSWSRSALV